MEALGKNCFLKSYANTMSRRLYSLLVAPNMEDTESGSRAKVKVRVQLPLKVIFSS